MSEYGKYNGIIFLSFVEGCFTMKKIMKTLFGALFLLLMSAPAVFADEAAHEAVSEALPIWSIIPFAGMLLSIAIVPLVKPCLLYTSRCV